MFDDTRSFSEKLNLLDSHVLNMIFDNNMTEYAAGLIFYIDLTDKENLSKDDIAAALFRMDPSLSDLDKYELEGRFNIDDLSEIGTSNVNMTEYNLGNICVITVGLMVIMGILDDAELESGEFKIKKPELQLMLMDLMASYLSDVHGVNVLKKYNDEISRVLSRGALDLLRQVEMLFNGSKKADTKRSVRTKSCDFVHRSLNS